MFDENEDVASAYAVPEPALFRRNQRQRYARGDRSADPGDWARAIAAPHGENRRLESGCSVAERQFRLTFRLLLATRSARVIEHPSTILPPELLQMRKAITFAISALLIACALMSWTISGVL